MYKWRSRSFESVFAAVGLLIATGGNAERASKQVVYVDGWGYIVAIKPGKVRVDQRTVLTRDKIEVLARARRAAEQSLPGCPLGESRWNSGVFEALYSCPDGRTVGYAQ